MEEWNTFQDSDIGKSSAEVDTWYGNQQRLSEFVHIALHDNVGRCSYLGPAELVVEAP